MSKTSVSIWSQTVLEAPSVAETIRCENDGSHGRNPENFSSPLEPIRFLLPKLAGWRAWQ
jgi:hypothetical protein